MRGALHLLLLSLTLLGCESTRLTPPDPALIKADADDVFEPEQIVVLVNTAAAARSLTHQATKRGYRLTDETALEELELLMLTYTIPRGLSGAAAIAELERLEPSATAGLRHAYRPQASTTGRRYASQLVHWPATPCRARHRIGLIDAAVNTDALPHARWTTRDFTGGAVAATDHGRLWRRCSSTRPV